MKNLGIYIHIPFCVKKCDYCDFISYCDKNNLIEEYIEKLKEEITNNLDNKEYTVKTIYIGGGTPSYIDSKYIVDILNIIKEKYDLENTEVTIEVNPGTVTETKLLDYKKVGINRLSIGLQETNNDLLKAIGRIHTYEQFLETYKLARKVGFNNINVDLMIGLPGQSIENIKQSLNKIIELNPEHISVYSLILEEGTKLYKKYEEKQIELPDEELERNMYWYVKNTLENAGYNHYEISNFAREGYESKHNSNCWNQEEYIGIGAASHSYINGIRYSNTGELEKYIVGVYRMNQVKSDELKIQHATYLDVGANSVRNTQKEYRNTPNHININKEYQTIHEIQTKEDMQKEYMLLGLRKIDGVSIQKFKNKFGQNPIFIFKNELSKLVEEDLLIIDGDNIKLTSNGLDLANLVWEEFV